MDHSAANYDTLADLPEERKASIDVLAATLFAGYGDCTAIMYRGRQAACMLADARWGEARLLPSGEVLQVMRWPKGRGWASSTPQRGRVRARVAVRMRRANRAYATVAYTLLVAPPRPAATPPLHSFPSVEVGSILHTEPIHGASTSNVELATDAVAYMCTADGLLSLMAGALSDALLPDALSLPHGARFLIAFAVRLAVTGARYGLCAATPYEQHANDRLRMAFETTTHAPLRTSLFGDGSGGGFEVWCIDAIMAGAFSRCATDKRAGASEGVLKHAAMWQRVGQHLANTHFGHYGHSGRDVSPTGRTMAFYTHLLSPAIAKSALITILRDVEEWLRTGTFRGVLVTTDAETLYDDDRDGDGGDGDSGLPGADGSTPKGVNASACGIALELCVRMLSGSDRLLVEMGLRAFAARADMTSRCSDCSAEVDVLAPLALANAFSHCSACQAPRCFQCAANYCDAVTENAIGSRRVGVACTACGAEPAVVTTQPAASAAANKGGLLQSTTVVEPRLGREKQRASPGVA